MASSQRLYSGMWTDQEQDYLEALATEFHDGALDIPERCTLRLYLAEQLGCLPKRISKRMENSGYNGRALYRNFRSTMSPKDLQKREAKLAAFREAFWESRESLVGSRSAPSSTSNKLKAPAKPKSAQAKQRLQSQRTSNGTASAKARDVVVAAASTSPVKTDERIGAAAPYTVSPPGQLQAPSISSASLTTPLYLDGIRQLQNYGNGNINASLPVTANSLANLFPQTMRPVQRPADGSRLQVAEFIQRFDASAPAVTNTSDLTALLRPPAARYEPMPTNNDLLIAALQLLLWR